MSENSNIFLIYAHHPFNGELHNQLVGKILLDETGSVHVLEDHVGWLERLESETPEEVARYLDSLAHSMYTEVVPMEDVHSGKRMDLLNASGGQIQEGAQEDPSDLPVSYHYHRIGMDHPQELKFENGKAYLDGFELSDIELARIKENVTAQRATLKRHQENLSKADSDLAGALGHVRNAVKAGTIPHAALKTLTGHIFKDTMVPSMGNKKAYDDFLSRPRNGVHIRLDGDRFGLINKQYGFEKGNEAIKHMYGAVRNALDESVGRKNGKAFRIGGDEGSLFVPDHQSAARFIRSLKTHLDKVPPVGGTHKLSMSIGVGTDPASAENALIQAKTSSKAANYQTHELKPHAHSSVPGFEGPLATE